MSPLFSNSGSLLEARAEASLQQRRESSTERFLRARASDSALLDLSDNDYLGLSRHPRVIEAACAATRLWGASSSASPLISGYTSAHASLEQELCGWAGFPEGLVWNSGYNANKSLLGTLAREGDLIIADKLVHNSLLAGVRLSGAELVRFPHNDLEALERVLASRRPAAVDGIVFVVTESVYSMDGDYPDLRRLAGLRARHGFIWLLDEAHALGWYGPAGAGLAAAQGVGDAVDILVGTLGKGLGSLGAFSLFRRSGLRAQLINHSQDFIYSTYLPPSCAEAARAALGVLRDLPAGEHASLLVLSAHWRRELRLLVPSIPEGDSPVIPIPLGDSALVLRCAAHLLEGGVKLGAVRPPTVPKGGARLRLSLRRGLGEEDLALVFGLLREVLP